VVSDGELRERAAALGVAVRYWDWKGNQREVPDETLAKIVAVIESAPPVTAPVTSTASENAVAPVPERRAWGFTLQLYSLRSRGSWGHGDLRDLADFAVWSARDLGADFAVINPLHAAEPLPPVSPSPYLPMSRRWISPLYLRIEDTEQFKALDAPERIRLTALASGLVASSSTNTLIDRDAVWTAKLAALETIASVPLSRERQEDLDAFRARHKQALTDWGAWCAIAEVHGPDYRQWPRELRHPRSARTAALRETLAARVAFHTWVQWLAAQQVAAAQRAAREAG
jgi:4-alpha-glucanotransferase